MYLCIHLLDHPSPGEPLVPAVGTRSTLFWCASRSMIKICLVFFSCIQPVLINLNFYPFQFLVSSLFFFCPHKTYFLASNSVWFGTGHLPEWDEGVGGGGGIKILNHSISHSWRGGRGGSGSLLNSDFLNQGENRVGWLANKACMSEKEKSGKEFPRSERISESGNSYDFSWSLPIDLLYFDIISKEGIC